MTQYIVLDTGTRQFTFAIRENEYGDVLFGAACCHYMNGETGLPTENEQNEEVGRAIAFDRLTVIPRMAVPGWKVTQLVIKGEDAMEHIRNRLAELASHRLSDGRNYYSDFETLPLPIVAETHFGSLRADEAILTFEGSFEEPAMPIDTGADDFCDGVHFDESVHDYGDDFTEMLTEEDCENPW